MHHSSYSFHLSSKLFTFVASLLLAFCVLPLSAAEGPVAAPPQVRADEREIRSVLDAYFAARASAIEKLSAPDFGNLTTPDRDGAATASREKMRLTFQIEQERLSGSTYASYTSPIAIDDLDVERTAHAAVADVTETDLGHTTLSPEIESKSVTHHTVTLRKTGGSWKVAKDEYADEINTYLFDSGKSFDQILLDLRSATSDRESERKAALAAANVSDESTTAQVNALLSAGFSVDEINNAIIAPLQQHLQETTTGSREAVANGGRVDALGVFHPLNAGSAVAYAHQWAYGRNPTFGNFAFAQGLGGDCTNFVSQVILAGGAPMMRSGSWQWFYDGMNPPPGRLGARRSSSWSGVPELYTYLVNNPLNGGPVGRSTSSMSLLPGNLVQLQNDGPRWGHSAVVVSAQWKAQWSWSWWWGWRVTWVYEVLVACHETDRDYFNINGWAGFNQRYLTIGY